MRSSIDESVQEKRRFYARRSVSQDYDRLRFGGPSGEQINRRELSLIRSLLPPGGTVLDLGCGTGRLSLHLSDLGYEVVGLDSSAEMLALARAKSGGDRVRWLQADAFALPLTGAAFDAVVMLRLAFHFADLRPLLATAGRVVKPGGAVVLDTLNWSPRALVPLGRRTWGSRVYLHRPSQVMRQARESGLEVTENRGGFLCSPYVYRLLPLPLIRALEQLERLVPVCFKARRFWRLRSAHVR